MTTASPIDPNRLLLTGENPYIRLSATDDGPVTSDASFWRILFLAGRPGARAVPAERTHRTTSRESTPTTYR